MPASPPPARSNLLAPPARTAHALKAGDRAPPFELADPHGQRFSLSKQLQQGPLIVLFTRGPGVECCRQQLYAFSEFRLRFKQHGTSLVALAPSWDEGGLLQRALPFPALWDAQAKVAAAYGLTAAPTSGTAQLLATYLIDRHGLITFACVDSDPCTYLPPELLLPMLERQGGRSNCPPHT